ncbi:hypothetical protein [Emticicia sp. BO119]|uniref:hypothetical protein n=1 Tax=Emticicia sp. BO119 TaxID=2757768 RepID=UPI0015F00029|nr:hypothetical protein [Emticicia sp. BO119]MBA4852267.1 hypothetical protein [Emticicia sp. BO119]
MKKLLLLLFIVASYKISMAQSVTLTPNNINSKQSSSTDNIVLQGTNPPNIVGIRHGGTLAAPSTTVNGSYLLSLDGKGHNSSVISPTRSQIRLMSAETWTTTANGTKIEFATTENGNTLLSTRMSIAHNGKIGIGTISPTGKLHIVHDGSDSDPHLRIHTTGSWSRINWSTNTNANYWTAQSDLESATASINYWRLEYNGSTKFTVRGSGDVGVGTFSPSARLHVLGDENTGTTSALRITSGTQNMLIDGNEIDALETGLYLNNNTNLNVILAQGGGRVGIGTTTPDNKLDVLGVIRANEVIVETGWADYVFDEGFELKSLSEVESFIKENKHLPDVPSARTVQEKGAHVAELMTKMMQKIEELTLYSIQQQKEIDALKKRLDEKK